MQLPLASCRVSAAFDDSRFGQFARLVMTSRTTGEKPVALKPFSATLDSDPTRLRALRLRIAKWLASTDVDFDVREAVMLATHEGVASAMVRNPSRIAVEARIEGRVVTVLIESHGSWGDLDEDEAGHRMKVIRGLASQVEFVPEPGHPRLRLAIAF